MVIAALFTVAKKWKQPKCPWTDEWRKKMWYIYIMECYSAIKKNEIMPFAAAWMDLEITILREVRQKKTNIYCLYAESKKMIQMNLYHLLLTLLLMCCKNIHFTVNKIKQNNI